MAALEQLELERANLRTRLDKVDALIVSMHDVFHLPARRPHTNGTAVRPVPTRPPAPPEGNGHGSISVEAIAAALRKGPMSPGDLAAALQVPAPRLRYHIAKLMAAGTLVGSGTTASRRIALAEPSAKEGP
jgi:hypothetical protein